MQATDGISVEMACPGPGTSPDVGSCWRVAPHVENEASVEVFKKKDGGSWPKCEGLQHCSPVAIVDSGMGNRQIEDIAA